MDDDYEDDQGSRPPSPSCVTDTVKDIMVKIVAKASAQNYARQNTHFARKFGFHEKYVLASKLFLENKETE